MATPTEYLATALSEAPEKCDVRDARAILMPADCRRSNGKKMARLAVAVPDRVVKALRGGRERAPYDVFIAVVPRGALDLPPIITPGDKRWRMAKWDGS